MGLPSFRFKQFEVWHDRCAQKVGTDGVLLGAWTQVDGCENILDIGTGSGLIALMMAQRAPKAKVVGVEIDAEAAQQAQENVSKSPFHNRIQIVQSDVRDFSSPVAFDCIVCNPPFFVEETLPDNSQRAMARHTALLDFSDLIKVSSRLMDPSGTFNVILPATSSNYFVDQCFMNGLYLVRQCRICTVKSKPPKRVMLSFSRMGKGDNSYETLVLQERDGSRSEAYRKLTEDFYL
ncbi:MAG: methyltransferase [Bacteroidaceae bacterium]|nr:methyltransferase [Bacteroidaceae bacterium]